MGTDLRRTCACLAAGMSASGDRGVRQRTTFTYGVIARSPLVSSVLSLTVNNLTFFLTSKVRFVFV